MIYDSNGKPVASRYRMSILDRLVILAVAEVAFFTSCFPVFGTVAATKTSPDGQWRIEVADYRARQVFELWATPSVGGVRRQIGRTVPALQDVRTDLLISADSRRVAYVQGETASGSNWRLWSTSIDRMDGRVISHQPAQPGVGFDLPIKSVCLGRYVEFRSDPFVDEQYDTFSVSFDGGWGSCWIFADGFEGGTMGGWR